MARVALSRGRQLRAEAGFEALGCVLRRGLPRDRWVLIPQASVGRCNCFDGL